MSCDLLSGTPTYRYVTLTSNVTSNVGLFKNPISKIWVATMMLGCVVQSYASFSKVKRKNNMHQFKFGLGEEGSSDTELLKASSTQLYSLPLLQPYHRAELMMWEWALRQKLIVMANVAVRSGLA